MKRKLTVERGQSEKINSQWGLLSWGHWCEKEIKRLRDTEKSGFLYEIKTKGETCWIERHDLLQPKTV